MRFGERGKDFFSEEGIVFESDKELKHFSLERIAVLSLKFRGSALYVVTLGNSRWRRDN